MALEYNEVRNLVSFCIFIQVHILTSPTYIDSGGSEYALSGLSSKLGGENKVLLSTIRKFISLKEKVTTFVDQLEDRKMLSTYGFISISFA